MKVSKGTIIRTACLALSLINQALAMFGKSPLPIDDAMLENVISFGFLTVTSIIAWWKNNSFRRNALYADEVLKELKANTFDDGEVI